ncbi:unannotated protein [freshwater metagenome]|uniref:Unannotated protein n=1 Tax=freshwater metagenome TaxID=449393 RepID=A0A6J7GJU4_9ZZZZ
MVLVHVDESCTAVIGAGSEVLIDGRYVDLILIGITHCGMQQPGWHDEVIEEPQIAELARLVSAGEPVVATLELE